MNDKFSNEHLKDMLKVMAGDKADEVEKIFNSLNDASWDDLLDFETSAPLSTEELYGEIVNCYFTLIELLGINDFAHFEFPDLEDSRRIAVDGKEYDLECELGGDNDKASEALCAIDCMMADAGEENAENILKIVRNMINEENQKRR